MPETLDGTSTESSSVDENQNTDAGAEGATPEDNQKNSADSSTVDDGKETVSEENWNPLDVVKKAVGDKSSEEGADEGQDKQSDKSSKSGEDGQDSEDAELSDEVTEDELKSYKPKTRKRIEGLLDDRQRLSTQVETLQPLADQMETLHGFMDKNNLDGEAVSNLLMVGALRMSDDPKDLQAALVKAKEFVQGIELQLGQVLPEDLQKKVDEGLLDVESAKEVALSRVNSQRAEARVEQAKTVQETTQHTTAAQSVETAVSDWQRQKMSTDPDYQLKAADIREAIELRVLKAGGRILDPRKAIEVAEEAYAAVNERFKRYRPTITPERKKVTPSKAAPGNMASAPNSALEAAKQGLAKSG